MTAIADEIEDIDPLPKRLSRLERLRALQAEAEVAKVETLPPLLGTLRAAKESAPAAPTCEKCGAEKTVKPGGSRWICRPCWSVTASRGGKARRMPAPPPPPLKSGGRFGSDDLVAAVKAYAALKAECAKAKRVVMELLKREEG